MKRIIGDDGKEYLQWEGQAVVPIRDYDPSTGVTVVADPPSNTPYTMERLAALRAEYDQLRQMTTWPTWLLGDPNPADKPAPRSEPEHPTGRFENLDWEADS